MSASLTSELFWAYETPEAKEAGALPPERSKAAFAHRHLPAEKDLARAEAMGRVVEPSDCGPIRVIGHYGFTARCPGRVHLERLSRRERVRTVNAEFASYGQAYVSGSPWPFSDSGFVASWVSGSAYVKVQTGIIVFFPKSAYLYQGPLPNPQIGGGDHGVMAGVEYGNARRTAIVRGKEMFMASLNAIVALPQLGETREIQPGQELLWFFPVARTVGLVLDKVSATEIEVLR